MRKSGVEVLVSQLPKCDFCSESATYDGKTHMGPWANMCESHYERHGVGLGVGLGQRLTLGPGVQDQAKGNFIATMDPGEKARLLAMLRRNRGYDERVRDAGGDEDYALWVFLVDATLAKMVGLTHRDLEDFAIRDAYDSGATPAQAADECMEASDLFGMMD